MLSLRSFVSYRKWSRAVCSSALSILALLALFASASAASSPVQIIGADFDYGYVPFGTLLKHQVQIVNHSDSTLRVIRTAAGCGCTKIPVPDRVAAPGETLTVNITLNLAATSSGQFIKTPSLLLNDTNIGKVTIQLRGFSYRPGDIAAAVRVVPDSVVFKKKGATEAEIEIRNLAGVAIQARLVTMPNRSFCSVELPGKPIPKGGSDKIRIKFNPACPVSKFQEYLTFAVTDNKMTRFTVPISLVE